MGTRVTRKPLNILFHLLVVAHTIFSKLKISLHTSLALEMREIAKSLSPDTV